MPVRPAPSSSGVPELRHADLVDAGDEALDHSVTTAWWYTPGASETAWQRLGPDPWAVVLARARYRACQIPLTELRGQYPRNARFWLTEDDDPERYELVRRLAAAVRKGGSLPPIAVTRLGGKLEVLDGRHRLTALDLGGAKVANAVELIGFVG